MIVGTDGTVYERISGIPDDASGLQMSPLADAIAFMTDGRVATIRLDGTGLRVLTDDTRNSAGDAHEAVTWSPDGGQTGYVANDDVYVMNSDGSNVRRLTTHSEGDYYPRGPLEERSPIGTAHWSAWTEVPRTARSTRSPPEVERRSV